MQVKNIQPLYVHYFETETSLNTLSEHVRIVAQRLYRDAIKNNFEITGPVYWIYEGADGTPETIFKLTIALPITPAEPVSGSEFRQKLLEPFRCLSQELQGDWSGLKNTYSEIYPAIFAENKVPSGQNREIYINMDFQNPTGNITEVQVGIL